MSKNCAELLKAEMQALNLDDNTTFSQVLEKNLAQLVVDAANIKFEVDNIQKKKNELYNCLMPDNLKPEDRDLMTRIDQVTVEAEELIDQLSKLNKACEHHCKECKSVTMKQLMSRGDQEATLTTEDLGKITVGRKNALKESRLKRAIKRKEIEIRRWSYPGQNLPTVKKMESLTLVHQNTTDFPEQMLGNALDKEDPTE